MGAMARIDGCFAFPVAFEPSSLGQQALFREHTRRRFRQTLAGSTYRLEYTAIPRVAAVNEDGTVEIELTDIDIEEFTPENWREPAD